MIKLSVEYKVLKRGGGSLKERKGRKERRKESQRAKAKLAESRFHAFKSTARQTGRPRGVVWDPNVIFERYATPESQAVTCHEHWHVGISLFLQ